MGKTEGESSALLTGVSPIIVDAKTGHAGQVIGRKFYEATIRRNAERLRENIERLVYPTLDLSRAYSSDHK
jgi:hypothetical protein